MNELQHSNTLITLRYHKMEKITRGVDNSNLSIIPSFALWHNGNIDLFLEHVEIMFFADFYLFFLFFFSTFV